MNKFKKIRLKNENLVYATAEGTVTSRDIANGKMIPIVIVDTENKKDIEEAIIIQGNTETGKITTAFSKTKDERYIGLTISFIEPVEKEFTIIFDADNYFGTIDLIIKSKLLYLQAGKKGDRVKNTLGNPKMLMTIYVDDDFKKEFLKILKSNFIKNMSNMSKLQKEQAFNSFYSEWSKITDLRMKRK